MVTTLNPLNELPGLSQMAQCRHQIKTHTTWDLCEGASYCCSTAAPSPELAPGMIATSPIISWTATDSRFYAPQPTQLQEHLLFEMDFSLPDAEVQPWGSFAAHNNTDDLAADSLASAEHLERLVASLLDDVDDPLQSAARHQPDTNSSAEDDAMPNISNQGFTTAMLRNLPNKYMRDKLIARLNECGFKGDMDFIYLPIDFRNKCNVGYCFVNFRTEEACTRFVMEFNGMQSSKMLPGFNSRKVLEVSPARVQGLQPNMLRLQGSPVMSQVEGQREWLPVLLDEVGSVVEFPMSPTDEVGNASLAGLSRNRAATTRKRR